MTFEERVEIGTEEVSAFFGRFSPPRGMAEDAQDEMLASIGTMFARRLPSEGADRFRERIANTFTAVLDHHEGYAWPSQGEMVKHLDLGGIDRMLRPQTTYKTDYDAAAAAKMNKGGAVSDRFVWGNGSERLLASGAVSRIVMDQYREGSVRSFIDAYRGGAAAFAEQKYGPCVRVYFGATNAPVTAQQSDPGASMPQGDWDAA